MGGFIGSPAMNFFNGKLEDGKFIMGDVTISVPEGKMKYLREQGYVGKEIVMGVRPEDIHDEPVFIESSEGTKISTKVDVSELLGAETMVYSSVGGQDFVARLDSRSHFQPGEKIDLAIDMNKSHFFDPETEFRIRPANEK